VILMGRQGDQEVSAAELAERAGTITWEITTRIGSRVRRVFV
jgi:alanine racemase